MMDDDILDLCVDVFECLLTFLALEDKNMVSCFSKGDDKSIFLHFGGE